MPENLTADVVSYARQVAGTQGSLRRGRVRRDAIAAGLVRSSQGSVGGGLGVYGASAGPNRLRQRRDGRWTMRREVGQDAAKMCQSTLERVDAHRPGDSATM